MTDCLTHQCAPRLPAGRRGTLAPMQVAIGMALVLAGAVLLGTRPVLGFVLFCGGAWLVGMASGLSEDRFMGWLLLLALLGVAASCSRGMVGF